MGNEVPPWVALGDPGQQRELEINHLSQRPTIPFGFLF